MSDRRETTEADRLQALRRLLHLLSRSLPMYFREARPWTPPGQSQAAAVLDQVAAEQARYAELVTAAIVERDGRPDAGCFPLEFTAFNDVSLPYALGVASQYQQQLIEQFDQCRRQMVGDVQLYQLAEEIYTSAIKHLKMLQRAASPNGA